MLINIYLSIFFNNIITIIIFFFFFFFFNDTATTEIYTTANTLPLHDALPIYAVRREAYVRVDPIMGHDLSLPFNLVKRRSEEHTSELQSLAVRSYAVFCS